MTATSSSPPISRCSRYSPLSSMARHLDRRIGAAEAGQDIRQHIAGDQRGDAELPGRRWRCRRRPKNAWRASDTPARIFVAWRRNWWPLWVMLRPRGWRSNRPTPRSLSSSLIASVTADCEIDSVLRRARDRALLANGDEILKLAKREGQWAATLFACLPPALVAVARFHRRAVGDRRAEIAAGHDRHQEPEDSDRPQRDRQRRIDQRPPVAVGNRQCSRAGSLPSGCRAARRARPAPAARQACAGPSRQCRK